MKRALVILLIALARPAAAHVGSPDVFFEGDAGPYKLFVAIRTPQVIPGVATIEIRSESADVDDVRVVPMRLVGPGSEHPPTPDRAERSNVDAQFFTASLWLMERGSMQVRVDVHGARGDGRLSVPVPAVARTTLAMTPGLGGLLAALALVLAIAIVAIAAGAAREAALDPGALPDARARRRARIAGALTAAALAAVLALGNVWWNVEADAYRRFVSAPWQLNSRVTGCTWQLGPVGFGLLPDHGHDMHLFLVRVPDLDALAHLHPVRGDDGSFVQQLPSLPAGRYAQFADIVRGDGFPVTGTGELELPALGCAPLAGDDSTWQGRPGQMAMLSGGAAMIFDRPDELRAGAARPLAFRVVEADGSAAELEPYMGMLGHAAVVRADATVFAHLHPSGSIAMPALALADPHAMHAQHAHHVVSRVAFPYGFPRAGAYRVFVQVKMRGRVETGVFDVNVE